MLHNDPRTSVAEELSILYNNMHLNNPRTSFEEEEEDSSSEDEEEGEDE